MNVPEEKATGLSNVIGEELDVINEILAKKQFSLRVSEIGTIISIGNSIAKIRGLSGIKSEEILLLPGNKLGVAFNLDKYETDIYLLDDAKGIDAGDEVKRTGRVMDIPVGEELIGRIIDPMGRVLDEGKPLPMIEKRAIEQEAPGITDRDPVTVPLQTGLQVIDSVIPIGRGQRELILGDRQTGKTAIAMDTIINQQDKNVLCIYCAIGQSDSSVAKVVSDLDKHGAMKYTIVISVSGDDTPGLNYIAPYSATTIGEYFMEKGSDVLVVYDDLTKHARSYRELSLLLRRPPAREAYPGDIFYIHSRLLERSTRLKKEFGGGSLTALPIIETQAENISAYIPTNLISITDGQIYLSPKLYRQGLLPAVDIGKSVSRVGGKTQLPAYRAVAGDLKLSYSQFEELETFARFGVQLDEDTRKTLERGRRVRQTLKQNQYEPIPVPEQIAVLLSVTSGLFDDIHISKITRATKSVREMAKEQLKSIGTKILDGKKLDDGDLNEIIDKAKKVLESDAELKKSEGSKIKEIQTPSKGPDDTNQDSIAEDNEQQDKKSAVADDKKSDK